MKKPTVVVVVALSALLILAALHLGGDGGAAGRIFAALHGR